MRARATRFSSLSSSFLRRRSPRRCGPAVGASSNKRTVGGFSFCGLSILVLRIAVSLFYLFLFSFRGDDGDGTAVGEQSVLPSRLRVPFLECYPLERSDEPPRAPSFTVTRPSVPLPLSFNERQNYRSIEPESIVFRALLIGKRYLAPV